MISKKKQEFVKTENYDAPIKQESIPVDGDEEPVYRFRLTIPHYVKK